MTIRDFAAIMTALPFPVAHYEFSEPTPAPCMVYMDSSTEIQADGKTVFSDYLPRLELYAAPGEHESEAALEELLTRNFISFTKEPVWISERHEIEYIYTLE